MSHVSTLLNDDILAYLHQHENKDLLRLLTCGSVDDGKSTLIGRLLYDSKTVFEDHLSALQADSDRIGNAGTELDLALLVDGLASEREQGITIDVAYRFFTTDKRKFIIADTPGHEQYTRNMATGASTANLAIVMVDARKGVLAQTRRHSFICHLLGIRHIVVAVNKMDLVNYSAEVFERIKHEYQQLAQQLGVDSVYYVPVSALQGDNVVQRSDNMPWYEGEALLQVLEEVEVHRDQNLAQVRFPVQYVNRPHSDFRGYCGSLASGMLHAGDEVMVLPSRVKSRIEGIHTYAGTVPTAYPGDAITLTLTDEVDIARGDVLVRADEAPLLGQRFTAHLVWLNEQALVPGREYAIKIGSRSSHCVVHQVVEEYDINTITAKAERDDEGLALNAIALCDIETVEPVLIESYQTHPGTGAFILIDRFTNMTVAAGMVQRAEARSTAQNNIVWHEHAVSRAQRAARKRQQPRLLWFTGLSGAGKSTLANAVEVALYERGMHTFLLDGDNVRHGLCGDLGFSATDRSENLRRVGEAAKLLVDAGLIVLSAFISPTQQDREALRALFPEGEFVEVFVDAPLGVCEERDPKGLYKKARAGDIKNFTGIDAPYEAPSKPHVYLNTAQQTVEECVAAVLDYLQALP